MNSAATTPAAPGKSSGGSAPGSGRVPYLDGIRAVAISLVLYDHIALGFGLHQRPATLWPNPFLTGTLGVHLFFVVSGFIITELLLREERSRGRISLRAFWVRRGWRILPALLAFLAVMAVLRGIDARFFARKIEFVMAVTFSKMLLWDTGSWWLGHTWSLSIEEQFYLLWPLGFLLPAGRRLWLLMLAIAVLGVASLVLFHHANDRWGWLLPAHGGYLIAGCFLALVRHNQPAWWPKGPLPVIAVVVPSLAAILLTHATFMIGRALTITIPLGSLIGGFGIALILELLLRGEIGPVAWLLERPALKWLGRISYSLYLWQQLFLPPAGFVWWQVFPQNLVFALIAGTLSYYLVECTFRKASTNFPARS